MSRWFSYLNSAREILLLYKGEEPFAAFLKKYFSARKKFGSTDRKQVSHLCYCYFRLGKALPGMPVEEKILTALFLCSESKNKILEDIRPEWNEKTGLPLIDKLAFLGHGGLTVEIFPWTHELSGGIDNQAFIISHLSQPDLFLRLRPGKESLVKEKLAKAGINFQIISDHCLALPNSSKIDEWIELDKEAVVQDQSSQETGTFLLAPTYQSQTKNHQLSLWDCCAASGGKSIMAKDLLGEIELTVSDVRESILANLTKRFSSAGIDKYHAVVIDLAKDNIEFETLHGPFSLILADLPCTGSGTWSRTPEQLYHFDPQKINDYSALQKTIAANVVQCLEPGAHLLYITCSVFKKENEEVVEWLQEKFSLQLVEMKLIAGYDKKADSMFAALLRKPD